MKYPRKWPRLAFANAPAPYPGPNVTVRAGPKWLQHYLAGRTSVVLLGNTGKPIGTAEIDRVMYLPFCEINPAWLLHDPTGATSLAGALDALQSAYDNFNPTDDVSVIWYRAGHG
jgi:hypothetical protein